MSADGLHVRGKRDSETVAPRLTIADPIAAVSHGARSGSESARGMTD